jgi:hypothetical protein
MAVVMRGISRRSISKYRNRKVMLDGFTFDSVKEADRYEQLRLAQREGSIKELIIHPQFDIKVNGVHICKYIADFSYLSPVTDTRITEDVKSKPTRTMAYLIKKKLMLAVHGIKIVEV